MVGSGRFSAAPGVLLRPTPDTLRDMEGLLLFEPLSHARRSELDEAAFDGILARNIRSVAEALRSCQLIGEHSTLQVLAGGGVGTQFENIDLLCVEVDETNNDFLRFVLFEDKLQRNPEQTRRVLAQVQDYVARLTEDRGRTKLCSTFASASFDWIDDPQERADWWRQSEPSVRATLEEEDVLVVIVGDRLNKRIIELVQHLVRRQSALSRLTWGLMSLALYQSTRDDTILVLPQVIGRTAHLEQPQRIVVEVRDSSGQPLAATVTEALPKESRSRRANTQWSLEEFETELARRAPKCSPVFHRLREWAQQQSLITSLGSGRTYGNWYILYGEEPRGFLCVYSDGRLELNFVNLRDVHGERFAAADERERIRARISAIVDTDIAAKHVDSWKFIPMEPLLDQQAWQAMTDLLADVYDVHPTLDDAGDEA